MSEPRFDYYANGVLLRTKHQQSELVRLEFPRWALHLVTLPAGGRVLDAGCGWGRFTWRLIEDFGIPPMMVVGFDPSLGMLGTFREEADRRGQSVLTCAASACFPPFRRASFDGVIAAHMLYEVEDTVLAVRELGSLVRPDGWLLATTNSDRPLPLLMELHHAALASLGVPREPAPPGPFNMENGAEVLGRVFRQVERHDFRGTTVQTPSEFADAYRTTGTYNSAYLDDRLPSAVRSGLAETFLRLAEQRTETDGFIRGPYTMGAFVCREPTAG